MSNARNLARLIVDSGGDVDVSSLGNVPPSNDASALTTGTLPVGRLPSSGVDASSLTTGSLGAARLPAGSVLQVVNFVYSTQVSTSSGLWTATGLGGSITPSSTSSKILILFTANGYITNSAYDVFTVYRNGATNLGHASWGFGNLYGNTGDRFGQVSASKLDSPATTSAVNYAVYFRVTASTGYLNLNTEYSTMTLMEIKG